MIRRWILYLLVVTGCLAFYWAYQQWFSWFVLVGVLCLPVAALILSLPAMLTLKLKVHCPLPVAMGSRELPELVADCPLPAPPVHAKIRVRRITTGQQWKLKPGYYLPADHCGTLLCKPDGAKVYDYLGLFFLRIRQTESLSVVVKPRPVALQCLPDLERYLARSWRPKPGGGFAENHELRLYRPGDSLNQVHWKLSAKTGKYIIREAMVPEKSRLLLSMILRGTPEELDRKFGRLLWLSRELLSKELRHEICVLTGKGTLTLPVTDEDSLEKALEKLLSQPPAPEDVQWSELPAAWQYRIGGGQDEA
jgi:hypothetical protein